jgi:hypothetical protein
MAEAQHRPGPITDPEALNKESARRSRRKVESGNLESRHESLFSLAPEVRFARGMGPEFHRALGPWNRLGIPPGPISAFPSAASCFAF